MRQKHAYGSKQPHPDCGSRPAKLSANEIKTIQALLKTADIPVAEMAERFGVARSTLYRAVLNSGLTISTDKPKE